LGDLRLVFEMEEIPLNNELIVYTVTLMLGTPPRATRVKLDTGSSDLVVETDSSDLCTSRPTVCSGRGTCKLFYYIIAMDTKI
jgi:hypothetical protein